LKSPKPIWPTNSSISLELYSPTVAKNAYGTILPHLMAITDKAVESSTSSLFKTIFNKATNEDSPAHSPFSLDQNPQEIAVKLISVF
jgi:hypothetical protein